VRNGRRTSGRKSVFLSLTLPDDFYPI